MPKKNPFSKLKNWISGFAPVQILLSVVGLLLMGLGISMDNPIMNAIGAALFGAAISNVFAVVMESDLIDSIKDILKQSLSPGMSSDNTTLLPYRAHWYYYYVTQMRGVDFWRLVKFDFSYNQSVGKLISRLGLGNKEGELEYYSVEGAIRRGALIIVFDPDLSTTGEPVMVNMFPLRGATTSYFGMLYLMTWDHTYVFSRCVISRKPIIDWEREQIPIPEELAKQLDTFWDDEFEKANKILRTIYKNPE